SNTIKAGKDWDISFITNTYVLNTSEKKIQRNCPEWNYLNQILLYVTDAIN
ncbi:hypothetical protein ACJMK2_043033, partial [Sinanodonta woodiana]